MFTPRWRLINSQEKVVSYSTGTDTVVYGVEKQTRPADSGNS